MLPNLTIGGAGCVDGPLCFAPEYWVKLFKAYNDEDLKNDLVNNVAEGKYA